MTGTTDKPMSVAAARAAWMEHRFFKYRGCAPHPDNPRVLAARPDLPVDTHHPADRDGAEPQPDRVRREQEAVELCLGCPVMVLCDRYANAVTPEGKLAEPDGVWGGRTGLERHKALIRARHAAPPAPDRRFATPQKQAVLRALAVVWDPYDVARAAGVDVRTANWQRSNLVTLLGLPRTASRAQLLAAAGERGLLEGVEVVVDDGKVPAVPPPTRMPDPEPESVGPTVAEAPAEVRLAGPAHVPAARRGRFVDVDGQLSLWEAELADVHPLFPTTADERLEAAA